MTNHPVRELEIFSAARRLPASAHAAYLDQACGGDAALRQRVVELLEAGAAAGDFMESPAAAVPNPVVSAIENPGSKIGRYKLLQKIGEGGCGVVYMAEQTEPVRRLVALKIIKLGMDTKSVIARFEAERQALALMDHPKIATVLDAGATEQGRPYFVMELVRGVKITEFCDNHDLTTRERLLLFIQVCQAVQHAHQKGIIHRDLKPSNILVTLNDGVPLPKVIDFGIAKATQQRLTDKTLFTAFEQFIGTPAYMSPEQAEMNALGVDTRSDIYSLGVLLYELLTGETPFASEKLMQAGVNEIRRVIREEEPVKPSTKLSAMLAGDLTITANRRQTEPPKLLQSVRGDLDWVVMKTLEKDRHRRYQTANGLAMDIQRHLNNEPVLACPPSELEHGDPKAADKLLPLVYEELRKLAASKMANESPNQTLQATALVHEAWLRLAGNAEPKFANRAHFFSAAAEAMRRILIDKARRKRALRHGGDQRRVDLDDLEIPTPGKNDEILAIDELLDKLATQNPVEAELVKLRYFVGMTLEEAADVLGVSARTADNYWAHARAWLFRAVSAQRQ